MRTFLGAFHGLQSSSVFYIILLDGGCGGLSENVSHRPTSLNACSSVAVTVWGGLGDVALLGRSTGGRIWEFADSSNCHFFSLLAVQEVSLLRQPPFMPAAMLLSWWRWIFVPLEQVHRNASFYKLAWLSFITEVRSIINTVTFIHIRQITSSHF